jgi:hypothetical protein
MKIGRNDPCSCGSGKKYKKCCWLKEVPSPSPKLIEKAMDAFRKHEAEQFALQEKGIFINYVNPCPYTHPKTGQKTKAWALGSRIFHTRPEHETFHDFIVDHLRKEVMGKDWWTEQLQAQQKHFLFECFIKWDEWRKKNATEKNRVDEHIWYAITDGWAKTLSSLAFDVCTLEHTLQLPDHILKRLRNRGEYQGAHYEIAVAAIFARLGCRIDFLDKKKLSTPHCEFIATHIETDVSIAVEAKSRQRPGVKHMVGVSDQEKLLRGDVERLFKKALIQNPKDRPFIVFIDVNAPLTPSISIENKPWFKDIQTMMEKYPAPTLNKPEEYTGILFTNFSPHYDKENKSSPNEYLAVIPLYAKYSMPNPIFEKMLLKAIQNYGYVPNIVEDK